MYTLRNTFSRFGIEFAAGIGAALSFLLFIIFLICFLKTKALKRRFTAATVFSTVLGALFAMVLGYLTSYGDGGYLNSSMLGNILVSGFLAFAFGAILVLIAFLVSRKKKRGYRGKGQGVREERIEVREERIEVREERIEVREEDIPCEPQSSLPFCEERSSPECPEYIETEIEPPHEPLATIEPPQEPLAEIEPAPISHPPDDYQQTIVLPEEKKIYRRSTKEIRARLTTAGILKAHPQFVDTSPVDEFVKQCHRAISEKANPAIIRELSEKAAKLKLRPENNGATAQRKLSEVRIKLLALL